MLRLIGAAAVLALAAANPALAQGKGNDKGGGKGNADHAAMDHGPGKSDAKPAKPDSPGKAMKDMARGKPGKPEVREVVERVRDIPDGDRRPVVIERTVVRDRDRDRRDDDWDRRDDWDGDGDWNGRGRIFASVPGCPPGLAKKRNGCLPPGQARKLQDSRFGYDYRPMLFGIPLRTRADYAYYDGYLVPVGGSGMSYIPLLGGALAVGQLWPQAYPSLELADWQNDYYGFDDPGDYRYADNVVYQVDPTSAAIEAVVALLTGNDFTVGERMPLGYDVYNVPGPYQDRYYDTDDAHYRYADGQILQLDPTTMLIEQLIELVV